MTKRKKLVVTVVFVTLAIGAIFGGNAIASAQDETTTEEQTHPFLDKIVEIYEENTGATLDTEQLIAAFQQAREELQVERQSARFDKLVEEGIITQEEADEYQSWLDAKPNMGFNYPGLGNGKRFELRQRIFGFMNGDHGRCFNVTESSN